MIKVLFVRTDGIGDLILTLPAAGALKRQQTHIRLCYLVSPYAAPLLEHHPYVDEVLCDPGPQSPKARMQILQGGFDAVIFFKPYLEWFWAAYRAGIRKRIGTGYRWYSFLLTDRVYEHRSYFDKHEAQYNLNLLGPLGVDPAPFSPPKLHTTHLEIEQADDLLSGLARPRVVIHPGNIYARNWRPERYLDLVKELRSLGFSVVLTGSAQERKTFLDAGREGDVANSKAVDLMGCLDLRQLISVISRCDLVISGSTGPMHIAAALGVATVSLFDPRRGSSPVRWGPLGERGIVLKPDVPTCEKCIYEKCPYWDCMDRIRIENVAQAAQEILFYHRTGSIKV